MAVKYAGMFYLFHPAVGYWIDERDEYDNLEEVWSSDPEQLPAQFDSAEAARMFLAAYLDNIGHDGLLHELLPSCMPYYDVVVVNTPDLVLTGWPNFGDTEDEDNLCQCRDQVPAQLLAR
jgi:hypothetical protein